MAKITGKTKTGYAYSYDERILTDWEFVQLLSITQSGSDMEKIAASTKVVELLVGKDKMDGLITHVRNHNDGFAPVEGIVAEFTDMIAGKNAKN
jgi:hypothetical protein